MALEKIVSGLSSVAGLGKLVVGGAFLSMLAFAPLKAQESKIAFTQSNPETGNISLYIANTDGTDQKVLCDSVASPGRASFSLEGNNIAVQRTNGEQLIMGTDGNIKYRFSGGNRSESDIIWGPDSTLYFGKYVDGIYRFKMSDGSLTRIMATSGYFYDHNPAISPDGTKIAFLHHTYGYYASVWMMDIDGNNLRCLTPYYGEQWVNYDEHRDLSWVNDSNIIFHAVNYFPNYKNRVNLVTSALFRTTIIDDTTALTKIFDPNFDIVSLNHLALSPDRKFLALSGTDYYDGSSAFTFFDTIQLANDSLILNVTPMAVWPLAWSKNAEYFVAFVDNKLRIFDKDMVEYKFGRGSGNVLFVDWSRIDPGVLQRLETGPVFVVDGLKDEFYNTLTGPDDGYLQIRSFAFNDNGKPANDADLSAKVWAAWNDVWLYVYAEIKDDKVSATGGYPWQVDTIELFFDPQPTDSVNNSNLTARLTALAPGAPGVVAGENIDNFAAGDKKYARAIIPGGYALEMALKWEAIRSSNGETITPEVDNVFGWATQVHDNDGGDNRNASVMWAPVMLDDAWQTPKYLGTLKFLPDNKLQFIPRNNMTGATNTLPYDGSDPVPVGIADTPSIPLEFRLMQNYPNPFNPSTTIEYNLPEASQVKLMIYDVLGNEVKKIVNTRQSPGAYKYDVGLGDKAAGIYFYELLTDKNREVKKMMLMK